jgi:ribosome-binding factor A
MTRQHGTAPSQRQLRVGEEIRHALARLLARGELHDPELFDVAITVTEVRLSPDLKHATAFVTPLGGSDMDRIVAALGRAAPFLQGRIGRELRLRFTPALHFEADRSFDEASKIDRLLHEIEREGDGGNGG